MDVAGKSRESYVRSIVPEEFEEIPKLRNVSPPILIHMCLFSFRGSGKAARLFLSLLYSSTPLPSVPSLSSELFLQFEGFGNQLFVQVTTTVVTFRGYIPHLFNHILLFQVTQLLQISNMKTTLGVLLVAAIAALVVKEVYSMPPQCSPEVLEEIENKDIRKLCEFLVTYTAAVEQYNRGRLTREPYPGLIENGVKRQDVDHVFLRFGRRR
ncbi:unnamed protein product [Allacma fusca]|uniref:Uncharacterized protein n=1 Tax=Allacma fusca TaxID=39272 RepID=A0A8J2KF14_9HEXA|nr:unnamed protein product [Allacma fusca]